MSQAGAILFQGHCVEGQGLQAVHFVHRGTPVHLFAYCLSCNFSLEIRIL